MDLKETLSGNPYSLLEVVDESIGLIFTLMVHGNIDKSETSITLAPEKLSRFPLYMPRREFGI